MFRKALLASATLLAATVTTAARAEWYEASSKHFVVYSDDSIANVKRYSEQLERFDKAMTVWHAAKDDNARPSSRVTVFVVSDIDKVQKMMGAEQRNIAGFYQSRAGSSVAFTPKASSEDLSSRAILFHEYAHHWMRTHWTDAALPLWFSEGFAELHATALFREGQVIFGAVPIYRRYTIGEMNMMPMARMLRFYPGDMTDVERDALYSHGWALMHYLTFDPDSRKLLAGYIGALNSSQQPSPNMLTNNSGDLDLKLASYVRRSSLPSAAFSFRELPIEGVQVRPLTPGEVAILPSLMASQRGVSERNADRVAQAARLAAAPFPADAAVQNELAEAEYDACTVVEKVDAACLARAEAAADRAIAADPKSVHALLYKGLAETAALKAGKITDPARWTAARRHILAANRLDSDAPQPLVAFYESFGEADQAPTKNAEDGLLYAYAVAPYDASLRYQASKILLKRGNLPQARIALAPAVFGSEAGARKDWLKILDLMDKGDAKAAEAEIKRLEDEAKAKAKQENAKTKS